MTLTKAQLDEPTAGTTRRRRCVGNLHFADEHCAFDNQGLIDRGVESGEWIARALQVAGGERDAA